MQLNRTLVLTLMAVLATLAALWWTHRTVTPTEATWDEVLNEARSGGYRIITAKELAAEYLENPNGLLLVDTRQDWEYRTGHIRGALNFPIEPTWWSRWRKSEALREFLGADQNRKIVFY